jgi:HlyD family secretion protein
MKKWGKWPLIGIGVLIVLAVVGMNSLKALAVETQVVTKGKVTASVVEKGKVVSEAKVDIFSDLAGKLKEIKVDEWDRVTKGQLIAVIDTTRPGS